MIKEFMLRWATADKTRVHEGGEWQLRFKGGRSHDFANKRLFLSHWLSVKNSSDDEIVYTFINDGAQISDVLRKLHAAGIPADEVEIDPSAGSRAATAGK
ncbi:MAG TPA: hypothetical protein VE957_19495 [Terriglobales bacterium]|nr:hypothetical protein [Terriglobales bacterium]